MSVGAKEYINQSLIHADDTSSKAKFDQHGYSIEKNRALELKKYTDLNRTEKKAAVYRWKAINHLDDLLIEFESNFHKQGGRVLWARDTDEIIQSLAGIKSFSSNHIVCGNRIEIFAPNTVKETLHQKGYQVSNFGQGIQGNGNFPHPVYPGLSVIKDPKVKESNADSDGAIGTLFLEVNFCVANPGLISIQDFEGSTSTLLQQCENLVLLCPIDRMISKANELELILSLQNSFAGINRNPPNHILIQKPSIGHGPKEITLIFYDNGVSKLLEQEEQRQALTCIRCGACETVCPVVKHSSVFVENGFPSGPIGQVISPWVDGFESSIHLSQQSTMCGKCDEVCPLGIPISKLHISNKRDAISRKSAGLVSSKTPWFFWKKLIGKRKTLNYSKSFTRKIAVQRLVKSIYGPAFSDKQLAPKTFNEIWREINRIDNE